MLTGYVFRSPNTILAIMKELTNRNRNIEYLKWLKMAYLYEYITEVLCRADCNLTIILIAVCPWYLRTFCKINNINLNQCAVNYSNILGDLSI